MSKHTKKSQKAARRRFENYRTAALTWACEGSRSLIITGHDDHCIQHISQMLTALDGELHKMSGGEHVPIAARALLVPVARSRHDAINEPRLRLAAMLGAIGHELGTISPTTPAGLKRAREQLADVVVTHAKAVLLVADLNAERGLTKAAA